MNSNNDEIDDILDSYGIFFEQLKNKNQDICPSPRQLTRYVNEELSDKEREQIEDHIDLCLSCLTALDRLNHADKMDQQETVLPENWNELEKTINQDFYRHFETTSVPKVKMKKYSETNWIEA